MPELPEVEAVMRRLAPRLQGRRIARATVARADLRRMLPPRFAERLGGTRVTGLGRRAKYLLMRLDSGESMLIHLGMSGRMVLRPPGANAPPPVHEHVTLLTDDGWAAGFVDPRRFGSIDLVPTAAEETQGPLAGLGPEPLGDGFDAATLSAALAGRRSAIKVALLDQHLVAGIGNIYASEALHRAGISPLRAAMTVAGAPAGLLVEAIRATLTEAIAASGSSLRDHVLPDGGHGCFQQAFRVYGREGLPCPACAPGTCPGIRRIVQAGRSTFYCPRAQR